jgi:Tol biopolymer transport system component
VSRWALAVAAVLLLSSLVWQVGGGEAVHDGAPSWSPDSRRIVFSAEHDGQSDLAVMAADGTGRRQLTSTPAEENAPAFSPDGTRIAFETNRDGNFEIYVMDANGRNPRRISNDPGEDRAPAWAPDGSHLAFLSDRAHAGRFDLYTMRADGTDLVRLAGDRTIWSPQYSPDGLRLAIQSGENIELIQANGGAVQPLTFPPANGMSPTWSPDGRTIAFASKRGPRPELFTMATDGAGWQPLVSMAGGSTIDPRWSPDGRRVAFVYVPDTPARGDAVPAYAIYVVDVETRQVSRLSP